MVNRKWRTASRGIARGWRRTMSTPLVTPPMLLDVSNRPEYVNSMSVATIQAELLSLPAPERARLIDVLWDSLSLPEVKLREAVWAGESERRIDAFEAGKLPARDAATVFSELRKDLRK